MARKLLAGASVRTLLPAEPRAPRQPNFLRWLMLTFAMFVILPTLVSVAYLIAVKTPLYHSEARFSVRSIAEEQSSAGGGTLSSVVQKIGMGEGVSSHDDLYAIQNFLLSRNAIDAIGGMERLKADFGAESIDPLSRMMADATQEDALDYWRSRIKVYVDSTSSILILKVGGFSPDKALLLANDLVAASERFLNDMTRRNRTVALEQSESVLRKSADGLAEARAQMLDFQRSSGILDPVLTVTQLGELIGELRLSQLKLESNIQVGEIAGSSQSARQAEQEAQLDILNKQIKSLEDQLAGSADDKSVAALLREYETLRVDQEFATEVYRMQRSAYEKARRQLEEQQRFIVQAVKPLLAEEPTEPTPLASSATILGGLFVVWGIAMLLIAAIRDSG